MTPGAVLHHKGFTFHDQGVGDKYLVVLNDGVGGVYIVAKTTSQSRNRSFTYGCNSRDIFPNFFIPDGGCCLRGNSWICLNEFYEFDAAELLDGRFKGIINVIGNLTPGVSELLINCAKDCDDISVAQATVLSDVLSRTYPAP